MIKRTSDRLEEAKLYRNSLLECKEHMLKNGDKENIKKVDGLLNELNHIIDSSLVKDSDYIARFTDAPSVYRPINDAFLPNSMNDFRAYIDLNGLNSNEKTVKLLAIERGLDPDSAWKSIQEVNYNEGEAISSLCAFEIEREVRDIMEFKKKHSGQEMSYSDMIYEVKRKVMDKVKDIHQEKVFSSVVDRLQS